LEIHFWKKILKGLKMAMTRRRFGLALAGAVAAVAAGNVTYEMTRGLGHSVSAVASEIDGFFYRGFPSRVRKAGFRMHPVVEKDSPNGVLLFGELNHFDGDMRKKIAGLIGFLVEQHGYDSLGMEGYFGDPRATLDEDADREFAEFFEGKHEITDKTHKVWHGFKPGEWEYKKVPIITRGKRPSFEKFLKQKSIPTYGIEDKMLYFETLGMEGLGTCIEFAKRHMHSADSWGTPLTRDYSSMPFREQVEAYVDLMQRKFPHIPFPGRNLEEMAENKHNKQLSYETFRKYTFSRRITSTNPHMARNIEAGMKKLGSKRGIVVVGAGHLYSPKEYSDGMPFSLPGMKSVQEYIAASALRVDALSDKPVPDV
jgi:hypothetical protein